MSPSERARASARLAALPTVTALALAAVLAAPGLARAQSPFYALEHAGTKVEHAIAAEREATGHSRRRAESLLKEAIEDLDEAGEAVEFAWEVGEISSGEANGLYDPLETAIGEDYGAESSRLTVAKRDARIRRAIATKEKTLHQIVADEHAAYANPFTAQLTPPAAPGQIKFGSALLGAPGALLGNFEADTEYWDSFYAALNGIGGVQPQDFAPVDGWLTGLWVKGYAVSGDMPGPGGSEPFRVGVEQALPSGQLQVLSTSTPPFQLPGTSGMYYYWVGPPYTQFPMPLKKGEYLSFDTRGGAFAVFSAEAGSTVNSSSGSGQEQNPGVLWTPTPHPNVALDVQWIEQPAVAVAKLQEAARRVHEALTAEEAVRRGSRSRAGSRLRGALATMKGVEKLIAEAGDGGEVSEQTEIALIHLTSIVEGEDQYATRGRRHTKKTSKQHIGAAIADKQKLIKDVEEAKSLAQKVQ